MDIITGYRGTPHITSMQDRAKNQGVIGEGSYILDVGQQLAAEIVSANEIRVRDGVLSHQGCVANIAAGAYDSLEISNGTQGMLRTDLIVARYTKDAETNVEDISLVVIEGEAAASSPVTPSYNEGDIQSGDTPVDMPLYKVNINGVTISSVDLIADNIRSLQSIGDTALPTAAQTISGAIAEHEADISKINGNLTDISNQIIVKRKTVTGTTSNYGTINLGLQNTNYEVVMVKSSLSSHRVYVAAVGLGYYGVVVSDAAAWSPVTNTNVTLTVYYRPIEVVDE